MSETWPEPRDRVLIGEHFADCVEAGDFKTAARMVDAFFFVANGGFLHFHRKDVDHRGRPLCAALKRDGELCSQPAARGERVCPNHRERQRQTVPDDEERE